MTFFVYRVAFFRSKCKTLVRLEAPTSYRTYDMITYRLRHILWIRCIVPATQVVRPMFYHTYDLLSWIATQVTSVFLRIVVIKEICLSRLLKESGTDTYLSTTYDFPLTFHSNHEPISCRFGDERRFQSKITIFFHPGVFICCAVTKTCTHLYSHKVIDMRAHTHMAIKYSTIQSCLTTQWCKVVPHVWTIFNSVENIKTFNDI